MDGLVSELINEVIKLIDGIGDDKNCIDDDMKKQLKINLQNKNKDLLSEIESYKKTIQNLQYQLKRTSQMNQYQAQFRNYYKEIEIHNIKNHYVQQNMRSLNQDIEMVVRALNYKDEIKIKRILKTLKVKYPNLVYSDLVLYMEQKPFVYKFLDKSKIKLLTE